LLAVGVGGPVTGKGGDFLIIDDPYKNKEQADSAIVRSNLWNWYRTTFRTRAEPGAAILIIMTRWHEDDLVANIIELAKMDPKADQFKVMNIPAIREDIDPTDGAVHLIYPFSDPRVLGEALQPNRYDAAALAQIKASISAREFQSLYQGYPVPPEGEMIKRCWLELRTNGFQLPKYRKKVRFWDWAVKEVGDPSAGALCSVDISLQRYIEDIIHVQMNYADLKNLIVDTALNDGLDVSVGLEEVGKDVYILKELKRELRSLGFRVFTRPTNTNKVANAGYFMSLAEGGMVTLVNGAWINGFISEACQFPYGEHDDRIDAVSNALNKLRLVQRKELDPEIRKYDLPPWAAQSRLKSEILDAYRSGHHEIIEKRLREEKLKSNRHDLNTNLRDIGEFL